MIQENVLPKGTVLRNGKRPYVIQSVLGQGSFGITYLVTADVYVDNIAFKTSFAIKECFESSKNMRQGRDVVTSNPNNYQEVKDSMESFLKEARRLNGRKHPNIVRVNESFRENGTAYYVMEYVKGRSLRDYAKGRLKESEALRIIKAVSSAVSYLHEDRITHLDIKPDNILLKDDGTPVLIDFGLAKGYDSAGRPTRTNKSAGYSDGYAPMEQYLGIKAFTPQADVYALAATLLYMLTGRDPRMASEISKEYIIESLKGIASPKVCSAILHGMEALKVNRTHTVNEFVQELVGFNDSKPIPTPYERPSHATMPIGESQQSIWVKPVSNPKPRPSIPSLKRYGNWAFVGGLVLAMFVAGYFIYHSLSSAFSRNGASEAKEKQDTTILVSEPEPKVVTDMSYTSPVKGSKMGTYTYTGPVDENDRPHGIGKAKLTNGDLYEGPFVNGVMEGENAKYYYKVGDRFEGKMQNDHFVNGTYTSVDGSFYKGTFDPKSETLKTLHGTWYDKSGKKIDEI